MLKSAILKRNLSHICKHKPYKETKWMMPCGNPTGLYVYNCVANDKVPVLLKQPHIATWYSCGPTVYDSAHIGHASCYVRLDIIQRILKSFFNVKLITAMGVTDIDDKIINKANSIKVDFRTVAKQYEHEFWSDMVSLNIEKPLITTKVSDYIPAIEQFVKTLITADMAYAANDGSVYFDTSKYDNYGKLQKMPNSDEPKSKDKKNDMDFALWKGYKEGEPFWNTSWGKGRPGWHIECSAMVSKLFGSQLDFHAGGVDLQFPHHENEEAQSCAFHNTKQWANYWIHVGHLHVKGDTKMSKSLKNTISISSLLEKYSADTFRMACLMSHYRYPMEYSTEFMDTAEIVLSKFKHFFKDAHVYVNDSTKNNGAYCDTLLNEMQKIEETVIDALKDDFDTSSCINNLMTLITKANKIIKSDSSEYFPVPVMLISELIYQTLTKFGLSLQEITKQDLSSSLIDTLVEFRHSVRLNALSNKEKFLLQECDIVRDKLKSRKIQINDSGKVSSWIWAK